MAISSKKASFNKKLLSNLPEGYLDDYIRLFLVKNQDGTYSSKAVSLGTDSMKQMEKKYGNILKTQYPSRQGTGFSTVRIRDVNSAILTDLKSKGNIVSALGDSDLKRGERLDKTAKKTRFFKGTNAFPFHHIMPIGGETQLTTNDLAVISKKMNSKLSPYNRALNDIADGISGNISKAFQTKSEGGSRPYLDRVDELNKNAEQIIAKVTKELPKKYQPYIGFTQLTPRTDEYGLPLDDKLIENRIGAVREKGIPIKDLSNEQLKQLKNSIKSLTEKGKNWLL